MKIHTSRHIAGLVLRLLNVILEPGGKMEKFKKVMNRIFIDGLSGMATGLFATLIIGTIIQQIAGFLPDPIGNYLFLIGKAAASITGAGIGCGVAIRFKESPLVTISAAVAGMTGAFAAKMLAGTFFV